MDCFPRNRLRPALLSALGALVVGLGVFAVAWRNADDASSDSLVYEAICRQLLDKSTVGRQGFVSSVWWSPLAVLLRLPFAAVCGPGAATVPSLLVSALSGAAAWFLFLRILRVWNVGSGRYVLAALLAAHPDFWRACTDGSNAATRVLLAVVFVYSVAQFVGRRSLGDLVYAAFSAAFLVFAGLETALWALTGLALFAAETAWRRKSGAEGEAALVLALLPAVYAVLLWLLANWLIMGDGLYFLRSVPRGLESGGSASGWDTNWTSGDALAVALFGLVVAMGLARGARPAVWLGLMGCGMAALGAWLSGQGRGWAAVEVWRLMFPVALLGGGYVAGRLRPWPGVIRWAPSALAAAAALSAVRGTGRAETGSVADAYAERNALLPRVELHVSQQAAFPRVFVCGYASFRLLDEGAPESFVHALDFNFPSARIDYSGQTLYLLVHAPAGRHAVDSLHWKYDRLYGLGSRGTLYVSEWAGWRLFEIIQAPRRKELR